MRRSFSTGNHRLTGSTEILRTVARSAARPTATSSGVHEPFSSNSPSPISSSKPIKPLTSSSGSTAPRNLPISAVSNPIMNYYRPSFPSPPSSVGEEFEWLAEDGGASASDDDVIFGPAPSVDEVQAAVSSLQLVIDPASFSRLAHCEYASNADNGSSDHSSNASEVDWMEPSSQMYDGVMRSGRAYNAFRLLQSDAAVQRMVVSLASDRAVWNAVLSNDVVRELRGSLNPGLASSVAEDSDSASGSTNLMSWIFESAKLKAMEIFNVINKIVNSLFQCLQESPVCSNPWEEKLRQSVMLTVMVLLVVVVTRGNTVDDNEYDRLTT